MRTILIILSLIITLTVQAQLSSAKVWNFRTSTTAARKPINADFYGTTVYCDNRADSTLWIRQNSVIKEGYVFYPYSDTVIVPHRITVTSNARYNAPYYQYSVKTSQASITPVKSNFTQANTMIIVWADSCAYQLIRGVVTKTFRIYPYPPLNQPCTYIYSAWSECQSNGTQTRTVISASPVGCTGTPVLSRSCSYMQPTATMKYVNTTGNDTTGNGTSGSPWRSIYKATSSTNSPDTIYVVRGRYLNNKISFLKTGVSIISDSATIITTVNNAGIYLYNTSVTNGNQIIYGLNFDGQLTGTSAIHIQKTSNVTVEKCNFKDLYYTGLQFTNINGTSEPSVYATGNKIVNCSIVNSSLFNKDGSYGSIYLTGQQNFEAKDFYIYVPKRGTTNSGFGLKTNYIKKSKFHDFTINIPDNDDNLFWSFAIELWSTQDSTEIYNANITGIVDIVTTLKNSGAYGLRFHNNIMGFNSIQSRIRLGILVEGVTDGLIIDYNHSKNLLYHINIYTLPNQLQKNISIHHNLFEGVGYTGNNYYGGVLSSQGGYPFTLSGVSFYNNTCVSLRGSNWHSAIEIPSKGTVTSFTVKNNIFKDFGNTYLTSGTNTSGTISAIVKNNLSWNNGHANVPYWGGVVPTLTISGNLIGNPLFNPDYTLQTGSPAINAGDDGYNIGK